MPNIVFTPVSGSAIWRSWNMEEDRDSFATLIFESGWESTAPTGFRLNYGDATVSFTGTGLAYTFDASGDATALTAGQITGMTVTLAGGAVPLSMTGLAVSATAFSQALAAEDSAALFNLMIAGADRITAGGGADRLIGHLGNDTINGGAGADTLSGDAGADRLFGGFGADRLTGGTGRDVMTGGAGRDVFVFTAVAETDVTWAGADVITDFRRGEDRIDLRAIDAFAATAGDEAFAFIGAAQFGNAGAGEVRFRQIDREGTANDITLVILDTDGDQNAEGFIRLNGLHDLTAQDFLL